MSSDAEFKAVLGEASRLLEGRGGVVLWASGAGSGKTTTALERLWPALRERVDVGEYFGPSRAVRDEAAAAAGAAGLHVARVPGTGEAGAKWARGGCTRPAEVERAMVAHPDGARWVCLGCPERGGCPVHAARHAAHGAPSSTLRASTTAAYALREPRKGGRRLVLLDEAVWPHVAQEFALDAGALRALVDDGVWVDPKLVDVLGASVNLGHEKRSAGWSLADACQALGVGGGDVLRVAPNASEYQAGGRWLADPSRASNPGPWQALEALRGHARAGTLGRCRVVDGKLWVPRARSMPWQEGDLIVCLDASLSRDLARVLWPAAPLVEVYAHAPHAPVVVHLDVHTSVERGGAREQRASTPAARACALAGRIVALGDAVGFTARRDLQDPQHPMHVEGAHKDSWQYHGSPLTRGSNKWKHLRRAVLLPHHVPHHALETRAASWFALDPGSQDVARVVVTATGEVRRELVTAGGLNLDAWRTVAREQIADAQTYQEAHRVRGLRASGREVWLIGARVPRWLRQEAAHVERIGEAALWALQGGALLHTPQARAAALRAAVDAHGGAWCPTAQPWTSGEARAALFGSLHPVVQAVGMQPHPCDALDLGAALGAHWAALASVEGLNVREVHGPKGRVRVALAQGPGAGAQDVGALQARFWPQWARLRADVGGELRACVEGLRAVGQRVTWRGIAKASGVSDRTWVRRVREVGLPGSLDALLDALDGMRRDVAGTANGSKYVLGAIGSTCDKLRDPPTPCAAPTPQAHRVEASPTPSAAPTPQAHRVEAPPTPRASAMKGTFDGTPPHVSNTPAPTACASLINSSHQSTDAAPTSSVPRAAPTSLVPRVPYVGARVWPGAPWVVWCQDADGSS